ncbi:MAG: GtrA family protein [Pseudomonadota bacterium]|nr:GtrA family protein [Pseudomonadota bacterium]
MFAKVISLVGISHLYRYTLVGAASSSFDVVVFSLMTMFLSAHYLVATATAVTVGAAINFFLCLRYVFVLQNRSKHRAWWYKLAASFLALFLNLTLMYILVDLLHINTLNLPVNGLIAARIVSTGIVFLFNYAMTKFLVFRDF